MATPFEKLAEEYLKYRKTLNLSRETLKADYIRLDKFANYLAVHEIDLKNVNGSTIRDYHEWLDPVKSRFIYLLTLKRFYHYALTHEQLLIDPFHNLELRPVKSNPTYQIPTPEQMRLILEGIDLATWTGRRDRAFLELVYSCGLRRSETIQLNLADIDLKNRLVRVFGKGKKERNVPIGKTALYYLKLYLKDRPNRTNPALFQSRDGERIGSCTMYQRFNACAGQQGLKFKFHSLRHACALHMLQNKAGIRHIQELLGHKNLETTQIYTQLIPSDLKKAHQQFHPREKEARHG